MNVHSDFGGRLVNPSAKDARMTFFIVLTMAVWALTAIIAFVKKDK
ncbi:hypothetical protein [Geobacter sp.]|nr:hypothetical protein [Geobacter sp.]